VARFDRVADRYDAFCATPLGAFVEAVERDLVGALLDLNAGDRVVDLGSGTGAYAVWMAARGCDVVGVDESAAMLDKARGKRIPTGHVAWVRGDLAQLPWASAIFDVALMHVTLEFVEDPHAALTEAMRVLKPGGRLVLGLIHGTGPWARHYRVRAHADPASVYHGAHFWTLPELTAAMAMDPSQVRGGLYVGPEAFRTADQAWALEGRYRVERALDDAGFLAVRYDKRAPAVGDPHGTA
jgi:SAM-dependent methyltransferase